jgi:hypothetical protein
MGSSTDNATIRGTDFKNNIADITINGSRYDEIINCTFRNPPLISREFNTQSDDPGNEETHTMYKLTWDIFTNEASNFIIRENLFKGNGQASFDGTVNRAWSSVIRNSKEFGGEVVDNVYDSSEIAHQTEGNNESLQMDCNSYDHHENGWLVNPPQLINPNNQVQKKLADQGTGCTPHQAATGNLFILSCVNNKTHINSNIDFDYYANGTPPETVPNCVSTPEVNVINCGNSSPRACPAFNPCPNNMCALVNMPPDQALNAIKGMSNSEVIRQNLRNQLVRIMLKNDNEQAAIQLLDAADDERSRKVLVPTYLRNKSFNKCRQALDSISQNSYENQQFHKLFGTLLTICDSGRKITEMNPNERQKIEQVANSKATVSTKAEAVLAMTDHDNKSRAPHQIQDTTNKSLNKKASDNEQPNDKSVEQLHVYPNPTHKNINIETYVHPASENPRMKIVNALGETIVTRSLSVGSNYFQLGATWETGLYLVYILDNEGIASDQRFIKLR